MRISRSGRSLALGLAILFLSFAPSLSRAQSSVHTLSLDEAIKLGLGRGEDITVAQAGVRSAEGSETIARSGMLPQVSASAVYVKTIKSQYSSLSSVSADTSAAAKAIGAIFSNLPFGKENQWTLGLTASETIFAGGRITAGQDAAEARKRSADIDLTAAEAQVALNVTQSYYDAVLADTLVKISADALKQAGEVYRQTDLAFKVGEKAEFDALRAKVARDNMVPVLLQSENDRDAAYYKLKQLLSIAIDDSVILTTPVNDSVSRFAMKSDTSSEQRASVRQAAEAINISDAQVRIAESMRWPLISVSSTYSPVAYPNNLFPNFNDWYTNWTASVSLSIPIYTGGNISGNVDVARASLDQANARLALTRKSAALDSRLSLLALDAAEANLRSTTGTVAEATRAYDIAQVRFTQGISTQVELDDARLQEQQARANWARSVRNFQVARAKLSLLKDLPLSAGQAMPMQPISMPQTGGTQSPTTGAPTGQ